AFADDDVGLPRRLRPGARCRPGHAAALSRPALTWSAIFSAIMIVGRFVLAQGMDGMTDASQTRSPPTPWTRPDGSVTAIGSSEAPIRQVPLGCQTPATAPSTKRSSAP